MDDYGFNPYAAPANDSLAQLNRMMQQNQQNQPQDKLSSVLNTVGKLSDLSQKETTASGKSIGEAQPASGSGSDIGVTKIGAGGGTSSASPFAADSGTMAAGGLGAESAPLGNALGGTAGSGAIDSGVSAMGGLGAESTGALGGALGGAGKSVV